MSYEKYRWMQPWKLLYLPALAVFLAINVVIPASVSALPEDLAKTLNRGIYYYDPATCADVAADAGTAGGGGPVYMMGDSITAGAGDELKKAFDDAKLDITRIDGVGSRSFISKGEGATDGLQAIAAGKSDIERSNSIIIALGTNGEDFSGGGTSSTDATNFQKNATTALNTIKAMDLQPGAKIYWVDLFTDAASIKHKTIYNKVINSLPGVTVIKADEYSPKITLADGIHPDGPGYKAYAKLIADSVKSSGGTQSSKLEGHELPATKGGTGLEEAIGADGGLVRNGDKVTFPGHASKGKEYQDYYMTMRWNYVKWNWNGTTTDANNAEYNWFKQKPRLVLVTNPQTKKSIIAAASESGPAPWTGVDSGDNNDPKQGWTNPQKGTPPEYKGRVSGFPPVAFKALGAEQRTDGKGGDLLYSWAPDQNAKPGPTDLSVDGSTTPNDSTDKTGKCACSANTPNEGGDVSNSPLHGKNNEEKIFNYFVDQGLKPYQAAGIMGNMAAESGLNPRALQPGTTGDAPISGRGYGLVQWTFPERQDPLVKKAKDSGRKVSDLDLQLDYVMDELNGSFKSAGANLKKAKNVQEATLVIELQYEIHAGGVQPARTASAKSFLAKYGSDSSGIDTSPSENTVCSKADNGQDTVLDFTIKKLKPALPGPGGSIDPKGITLHWWGSQAGKGIGPLANTLRDRGLSVQFGVTSDGEVYQLTPQPTDLASHAIGANSTTFGIEIEGSNPEFGKAGIEKYPKKFEAVVALVQYLKDKYNIPTKKTINCGNVSGIIQHKDLNNCPRAVGKDDIDDYYYSEVIKRLH